DWGWRLGAWSAPGDPVATASPQAVHRGAVPTAGLVPRRCPKRGHHCCILPCGVSSAQAPCVSCEASPSPRRATTRPRLLMDRRWGAASTSLDRRACTTVERVVEGALPCGALAAASARRLCCAAHDHCNTPVIPSAHLPRVSSPGRTTCARLCGCPPRG